MPFRIGEHFGRGEDQKGVSTEPMRVLFGEPLDLKSGTVVTVTAICGTDIKNKHGDVKPVILDGTVLLEELRRATRIGTPGQTLEVGDVCLLEPDKTVASKDEAVIAMERGDVAQKFLTEYFYKATMDSRADNGDIKPATVPLGKVLEAHLKIVKKPTR